MKETIKLSIELIKEVYEKVNEELIGREIIITSNYNGQEFGISKPSLKGKKFKIEHVSIDNSDCWLWIIGHRVSINVNEVEFVE